MADHSEQLQRERERGKPAGIAAILSGVLAAVFVFATQAITRSEDVTDSGDNLRFFAKHTGEFLLPFAARSISFLLLIPVVLYLYDATKYRHPRTPSATRILGIGGAAALGIATLLAYFGQRKAGAEFLELGALSPQEATKRADDLLAETPVFQASSFILLAGTLGLAFWLVLNSLNALRAGLLSKFMGYLGVMLGPALVLLPFTPIILAFWLISLGTIFMNILPRGRPPAWASGVKMPWPSAADRYRQGAPPGRGERGEVVEGTAEATGGGEPSGNGEAPAEIAEQAAAQATGEAEAAPARKRKRKRR